MKSQLIFGSGWVGWMMVDCDIVDIRWYMMDCEKDMLVDKRWWMVRQMR